MNPSPQPPRLRYEMRPWIAAKIHLASPATDIARHGCLGKVRRSSRRNLRHKHRIRCADLLQNPHPLAVTMFADFMDKVEAHSASASTTMKMLEPNIGDVWEALSAHPSREAVALLRNRYPANIVWTALSRNSHPDAVALLQSLQGCERPEDVAHEPAAAGGAAQTQANPDKIAWTSGQAYANSHPWMVAQWALRPYNIDEFSNAAVYAGGNTNPDAIQYLLDHNWYPDLINVSASFDANPCEVAVKYLWDMWGWEMLGRHYLPDTMLANPHAKIVDNLDLFRRNIGAIPGMLNRQLCCLVRNPNPAAFAYLIGHNNILEKFHKEFHAEFWADLCANPAAIDWLECHQHEAPICWASLMRNPAIFVDVYETEARAYFRAAIAAELMAYVWHPRNMGRFAALGEGIDANEVSIDD